MTNFKSFRKLAEKQKNKMDEFVVKTQQGAVDVYGANENTNIDTGYLKSAFRVSNAPGQVSSVRTRDERIKASGGTRDVDRNGLKQTLKSTAGVGTITYHFNEAFYAIDHHEGLKSNPRKLFYKKAANEVVDIARQVAQELKNK